MKNKKEYKKNDKVITKKRLLGEVNNSMCHNWYYEYHFRLFNTDDTYFHGHFVLWFDIDEICEYFGTDHVTKKQIAEYADEIGWNFLASAPDEVTKEKVRPFWEMCRDTIRKHNENH